MNIKFFEIECLYLEKRQKKKKKKEKLESVIQNYEKDV